MVYQGCLQGKYISLRSVEIADAIFTSKLRGDDELCKKIHKVDASVQGQEKYIVLQRETQGDLYFIIRALDDRPLGTIALYHMDNDSAEIGRWVSYGNAFENLEAIILLHDMAFEQLHLETVFTCTNIINERVKNFWKRFGGDETFIEEQEDFVASKNIVTKTTYYNMIRPRMIKMLQYR